MYAYRGTVTEDVKGDNFHGLHMATMDILRKVYNYTDLCTDKVPATTQDKDRLRSVLAVTADTFEKRTIRAYLNDLRDRGMMINRSVVDASILYLNR